MSKSSGSQLYIKIISILNLIGGAFYILIGIIGFFGKGFVSNEELIEKAGGDTSAPAAVNVFLIVLIVKAIVVPEPDLRFLAALTIMSLFAGLQLFCTGVLGQYLSRTYLEVKHRPIFIMRENEEIYRSRREEEDE